MIELLVVIAILAVLAVVVVLTLNPAGLLREARGANRISDMSTLQSALNLYTTDVVAYGSATLGSSNTVYISIPDPTATSTAGDQCQGLGLPPIALGLSYHCAASSTYRLTNGTGWIPASFNLISSGAPVSLLPVDPVNTTSSGYFYEYATANNQFDLAAGMEASKDRGITSSLGSSQARSWNVDEVGSNETLIPLRLLEYRRDPSLVGCWPMDGGVGSATYDYSSSNATGSWSGTATGTSGYYSPGKIGNWAGAFDGVTTQATGKTITIGSAFTFTAWIEPSTTTIRQVIIGIGSPDGGAPDMEFSSGNLVFNASGDGTLADANIGITGSNWHQVVIVWTGSAPLVYLDGVNVTTVLTTYPLLTSGQVYIGSRGGSNYWGGLIQDIRIYNRALSAAEIQWLYNNAR